MRRINEVLEVLIELEKKGEKGISAKVLSEKMSLDRATVSRYLNNLYKEGAVSKIEGRPVLYVVKGEESSKKDIVEGSKDKEKLNNSLDRLVGADASLGVPIQQAKAAVLYPPTGLHTLILGETGVGKSMFAEAMYDFAKESKVLDANSPFVRFNCADYADNPQLVIAQIFGVKRGAYTGADKDRDGLLKQADSGILFLDEIHRLSPQGQEMLFTFIDKGQFRPLGDTENLIKVDVQIIAATTEDPKSYLLKTFTRRIPMTITLPPLRERSLGERYKLLEEFIKAESKRLGESIYFNRNALISFLLYECSNNIGQLKSDIQLACAKAFLNYKSNNKSIIIVEQSDLQGAVKRGIMKLKEHRNEIDKLFQNLDEVIKFSYKDKGEKEIEKDNESVYSGNEQDLFYSVIENKLEKLKNKGLKEDEIKEILNVDIEDYFRKYMSSLDGSFRKEEISKIVSSKVVDIAEKAVNYAAKKLHREYDDKIYFGLALHLQGSIERLLNGDKIYHPKLNSIRSEYKDEFMVAMEVSKMIEDAYGVEVPLDEIGYITMFLKDTSKELEKERENRVGVLVIMHGESTASSMVKVSNKLIGEEYVEALDMPLSMKAEDMLKRVREKVKELDKGKGVIILADMGSLVNFGDIIKEDTGINIKTVDMVTTLTVIEAGRKALIGRDIDSIYRACKNLNTFGLKIERETKEKKGLAIITTCFTGEGSAEKIKKVIEENIIAGDKVKVIPVDIIDSEKFHKNIEELKKEYNIIAIVGTVNMNVYDIPFITFPELLGGNGLEVINSTIVEEVNYNKVTESLKSQIKELDSYKLSEDIKNAIKNIEDNLDIKIEKNAKLGVFMHLCFLVDKLHKKGKETPFVGLNEYRNEHNKDFILIKNSLKILDDTYKINIGDNEIAYIVKMVLNNSDSKE
ncbi:sigma 54-interacting transcriptional regulator [Clostridium chrysemydis]|uniref:sigma 54-interacting transcriptional regulator n=1 Tax=Clostridium chrysemydis TaxID=2665504 RepID=UPI0018840D10|nr:sigma-54-dependent transcriptional regulator [Clostridium chrysemydis]